MDKEEIASWYSGYFELRKKKRWPWKGTKFAAVWTKCNNISSNVSMDRSMRWKLLWHFYNSEKLEKTHTIQQESWTHLGAKCPSSPLSEIAQVVFMLAVCLATTQLADSLCPGVTWPVSQRDVSRIDSWRIPERSLEGANSRGKGSTLLFLFCRNVDVATGAQRPFFDGGTCLLRVAVAEQKDISSLSP